jgi:hypothetical protein
MNHKKKRFQVYYLLVSEGTAEYNLFGYLKNRFKDLFDNSNIKFSDTVQIPSAGISNGKLNGASDIKSFNSKYKLIKKYKDQKRFFILDKDLDDSEEIADAIKKGEDIVQFIEYNSEYLLLNFAEKNPKKPSEFKDLKFFRKYCKDEFKAQFGKEASAFKDQDFEKILNKVGDEEIKKVFSELFNLIALANIKK